MLGSICPHTKTRYTGNMPLKILCSIPAFIEQRDVDSKRVEELSEYYMKKYEGGEIDFDDPIKILENKEGILLDRENKRNVMVIVDGQHRKSALQLLLKKNSKIGNITVPVYFIKVDTVEKAKEVQYNLFQQKPVAEYDKLLRTKYNLRDILDICLALFKTKNSKLYSKYFKDGNYGTSGRKFRLSHFLWEEVTKSIRDSSNITKWISREVQGEEVYTAIFTLIDNLVDEFNDINSNSQRFKFINLNNKNASKGLQKFVDVIEKEETYFNILSHHYYKNYDKLVSDLEYILSINVYGDNSDSEIDE
jgi:hypothetical protein